MIKVKSKLENNIFDGVLIKKGYNIIENNVYFNVLEKNPTFTSFKAKGFIKDIAGECEVKKECKTEEKPDFASMSYADLKKYVKDNNIEVESMKKDDIYKALGI